MLYKTGDAEDYLVTLPGTKVGVFGNAVLMKYKGKYVWVFVQGDKIQHELLY